MLPSLVVLDKDAKIIDFETTLDVFKSNDIDYIGEDWFHKFITIDDMEKVYTVFLDLLNNKTERWKTFNNDIRVNGKHIYLDFENDVITINGDKYIYSVGVENFQN
mgnify:CR=1 FL=1